MLLPFSRWNGADFSALPILLKSAGKCTTDHISPAGPWLKYRGHLDRISDNMYLGANNAFAEKPGTGINITNGTVGKLSDIARDYKRQNIGWVVVGDQNYGEGSSREHAAMSPRFLGCKVVIARSFARIAETNLKQQGVLPLTFSDPAHYELVRRRTIASRCAVFRNLAVGKPVEVILIHGDGSFDTISANHTLTAEHIGFFKAGSALNFVGDRRKAEAAKTDKPADNAGDKPASTGEKRNPACKCKRCACGDKKNKAGGAAWYLRRQAEHEQRHHQWCGASWRQRQHRHHQQRQD